MDFVTANSKVSKEDFERYMMSTSDMATDVGTILYGKQAVECGLIDPAGRAEGCAELPAPDDCPAQAAASGAAESAVLSSRAQS